MNPRGTESGLSADSGHPPHLTRICQSGTLWYSLNLNLGGLSAPGKGRGNPVKEIKPLVMERTYELMFIVNPDLGKKPLETLLQRIKGYLEAEMPPLPNSRIGGCASGLCH